MSLFIQLFCLFTQIELIYWIDNAHKIIKCLITDKAVDKDN
jgi:hypothetical protein